MRIGLGIALAAFATLLSFFLAGAGEGWVTPFFASFALWLFLPIALAITWPPARGSRLALLAFAVLAIAADAWLIRSTLGERSEFLLYIEVNGMLGLAIIGLWLCLWFFWQLMLVHALVARRSRAVA